MQANPLLRMPFSLRILATSVRCSTYTTRVIYDRIRYRTKLTADNYQSRQERE